MENYKTKKRIIAIDFSKDKERALRILEDEKKAREKMRKLHEKGIEIKIPKEIDEVIREVELA